MRRALTLFPVLLIVSSCLSQERAEEKWSDWLAEHDDCVSAEDCALVYPGCPLGCVDAVNASYVDEAEDKARRLIKRYEMPGRACDYDCMGASGATCDEGRCTVVFDQY